MHSDPDKFGETFAPEALVVDIRSPSPPRLDFILLGDFVAELNPGTSIEAGVGLFVPGRWTVRVGGNVLVGLGEM